MFNLSIFIYIFNEDYLSNVSSINFFNSFFQKIMNCNDDALIV